MAGAAGDAIEKRRRGGSGLDFAAPGRQSVSQALQGRYVPTKGRTIDRPPPLRHTASMLDRLACRACILLVLLMPAAGPARARSETDVMNIQRAMTAAADARDRRALERGIADALVITYRVDGPRGRHRWGTSDKARVISRWTRFVGGALPTRVLAQRAVVRGDAATVFACIVDRARKADGREERSYSRVADTFARQRGRWLWIAAMEVQVPHCG